KEVESVPLSGPYLGEREEELVLEVLRSGRLSLGPTIDRFEELVAARVGAPYAAAVSSGTTGLHLLCVAAGIGPGDEVITSPYSFAASANCFLYEGGIPVFADIDRRTLNLDPAAVEAASRYEELLRDVVGLELPCPDDGEHVRSWFVYVVLFPDAAARERVVAAFEREAIGCNRYLPSLHLQPYLRERYAFREGLCPVS